METERGTTQEFNRFPFVRDLHEIQPVFPEADFGLGITSGLPVIRTQSADVPHRTTSTLCQLQNRWVLWDLARGESLDQYPFQA
jgi:hypothetical protein